MLYRLIFGGICYLLRQAITNCLCYERHCNSAQRWAKINLSCSVSSAWSNVEQDFFPDSSLVYPEISVPFRVSHTSFAKGEAERSKGQNEGIEN